MSYPSSAHPNSTDIPVLQMTSSTCASPDEHGSTKEKLHDGLTHRPAAVESTSTTALAPTASHFDKTKAVRTRPFDGFGLDKRRLLSRDTSSPLFATYNAPADGHYDDKSTVGIQTHPSEMIGPDTKALPPRNLSPLSPESVDTCNDTEFKDIKEQKQSYGFQMLDSATGPKSAFKDLKKRKALEKENDDEADEPARNMTKAEILLDKLVVSTAVEFRNGPVSNDEGNKSSEVINNLPVASNLNEETLDLIFGNTLQTLDDAQSQRFKHGMVTCGNREDLTTMLSSDLPDGTHGCLISKKLTCCNGLYEEDVNYVPLWSLHGSKFVSSVLCKDAVSSTIHVRRRIKKTLFRQNAVVIPAQLKHPNIEAFYGLIQQSIQGVWYMDLFMQYSGMPLDIFMSNKTVGDAEYALSAQRVLHDLATGLEYIHRYGIIHLNFKVNSINVIETDGYPHTTISDFELAKCTQDLLPPGNCPLWTVECMSPETCKYCLSHAEIIPIETKADIFSFGILAASLYLQKDLAISIITNGKSTYSGFSNQKIKDLKKNLMQGIASMPRLFQDAIPDSMSGEMRTLVSFMLEYSPSERPTAEHVKIYLTKVLQTPKADIGRLTLPTLLDQELENNLANANQWPSSAAPKPDHSEATSTTKKRLREKIEERQHGCKRFKSKEESATPAEYGEVHPAGSQTVTPSTTDNGNHAKCSEVDVLLSFSNNGCRSEQVPDTGQLPANSDTTDVTFLSPVIPGQDADNPIQIEDDEPSFDP